MDKELQQKLFDRYPKIFVEKDLPMSETCMCWGVTCGNGWFDLIDELCRSLQFWTDNNDHPQVVATQVKEKLGTLRFYTHEVSEIQDGMIMFAEYMSGRICDVCGAPGVTSSNKGWISTRCKKHEGMRGAVLYED